MLHYSDQCIFFARYTIQVQSICVPILRSIGWKLTILEKVKKIVCFLWRHVSHKRDVVRQNTETMSRIRPSNRNILQPTRSLYDFKCYVPNSGFHVFTFTLGRFWLYWSTVVCRVGLNSCTHVVLFGAKLQTLEGEQNYKQTDGHTHRQTGLTNILCVDSSSFAK